MTLKPAASAPIDCSDWGDLADEDGFLALGRNRYHCNYVIYTDGAFYYAEFGGLGGGLAFGGPGSVGGASGTDFIEVFNACHNALASGGKIFIKRGSYSTDLTMTITQDDLTVEFESGSLIVPDAGISPVVAMGDDTAYLRRSKLIRPRIDGSNLIANTTYFRLLGCLECELKYPSASDYSFCNEGVLIQGGAFSSFYNLIHMPRFTPRIAGGAGIRLNGAATVANSNMVIGGVIASVGYPGTIGIDVANTGIDDANDNWFFGINLDQPADGWEVRDNGRRNRFQVRLEADARVLIDDDATDTMWLTPLRSVRMYVQGTYPIVLSNEYASKRGLYDLGNVWFHDPFLGAAFKPEWNNADVGGTSALANGRLDQSTGATLGWLCQLDWNGERGIPSRTTDSKNHITARVELQDLTQMTAYFGFWRDATHYLLAYYDSLGAAANWFLRTDDGAGPTSVDSGILGDVDVHEFMISQFDTNVVDLYIDGDLVATSATNLMSGISEVIIYLETKENVDKSVLYDRFSVGSRVPSLT